MPTGLGSYTARMARLPFAVLIWLAISCPPVASRSPVEGSPATSSSYSYSPARLPFEPDLDAGFRLLYTLKFDQARERFLRWEQQQPADPLGPALEAAGDLFQEFYRKDVLTSEFFLDDKSLLGGIATEPDAALEQQFAAAANRSEQEAGQRLAIRPKDPDALFALTLVEGMRADDLFLIQKRRLDSLHYLRESESNARTLLAVAPDTADAYVALGAANYITGCLPSYKRALLWFGGIHGDKSAGIQQLQLAASDGHYLRPYAMLLLALAQLRENKPEPARLELADLAREFPENPLFARELAKITPMVSRASPSAR
jgi:hypothetical protein